MAWIGKWVSGGIGVAAGVLGIVSAVGEPLKVVGDMEVHPTAWVLLATVFTSVCCALVVPGLFERWWAAPRRARVERQRRHGRVLPEPIVAASPSGMSQK